MESLQNIIWILKNTNEGLDNFFAYIHEYALKYLENTDIQLNYEVDEAIKHQVNLSQEVKRNIFLAIKEILNNAIKHANCTEINFVVENNSESIQLSIQDNGNGIVESKIRKNGNGIIGMKDRIKQIGGNIDFIVNETKGLKIIIIIPIKFTH